MEWGYESDLSENPDYDFLVQQYLNHKEFKDWFNANNLLSLAEWAEGEELSNVLEGLWAMRMEIWNQSRDLIEWLESIEDYERCALIVVKEKQLRVEALELEMKLERRL